MKKNQKFDVSELPSFDTEAYLDSEEAIAAFLADIIDANDASLLASELGDIARARGMAETSMHSEKRGADGRHE